MLALSVTDEGYFRNASCALVLISTLLFEMNTNTVVALFFSVWSVFLH